MTKDEFKELKNGEFILMILKNFMKKYQNQQIGLLIKFLVKIVNVYFPEHQKN